MTFITDIAELEKHYGNIGEASTVKVSHRVTAQYRRLIDASSFVALATVGPEGLDCSPRGDTGQSVFVQGDKTLLMPDRRGNNRLDSLRNVVRNPEVAMLFLIPGSNTTVRLNGKAAISVDPALLSSYAVQGKKPRSVLIITVREIYFQCARAVMRAGLWDPEKYVAKQSLPSPGQIMQELKEDFDGETYDAEWPARAEKSMW